MRRVICRRSPRVSTSRRANQDNTSVFLPPESVLFKRSCSRRPLTSIGGLALWPPTNSILLPWDRVAMTTLLLLLLPSPSSELFLWLNEGDRQSKMGSSTLQWSAIVLQEIVWLVAH
ncbi:hypothetical protein CDAR_4851 [Caerostris darwini]|uniref:Uncharacterized protein n=1 Tax=Caerostris darwini TaxID=1538125 RepID=A0AAV4P413_9ARAC|nr:hypothetical protein CDAR_4851 [Caerostris darwini]